MKKLFILICLVFTTPQANAQIAKDSDLYRLILSKDSLRVQLDWNEIAIV